MPIVAVSATSGPWDGQERVRVHINYIRSLEAAGLTPVVVPPLTSLAEPQSVLAGCGGLLLTGGEDVDPSRYGAAPHPATGAPHVTRDATEIALFEAARHMKLPVLAICRGIQLVNVAMGGSLIQDIPSERPSPVKHDRPEHDARRMHAVAVTAGTRLASALGATAVEVNSYHHQAVDRAAEGLRVVATAPDEIVEGIEGTDPEWWLVGVQWHPEDLTTDGRPWDRGLFAAFAGAVADAR